MIVHIGAARRLRFNRTTAAEREEILNAARQQRSEPPYPGPLPCGEREKEA
jgi:hypothetical protein